MSGNPIAFAKEVAALSPTLTALLEEHMKDNFGEVLPHVYFGDVTRHAVSLVQDPSHMYSLAARRELETILNAMEAGFAAGTPEVQELIAASFLENLPAKDDQGFAIRSMVGRKLRSQLKKMI